MLPRPPVLPPPTLPVLLSKNIHFRKIAHLATFQTASIVPLGTIGTFEEFGAAVFVARDSAADSAGADAAYACVIFDAFVAYS